MQLQEQFFFAKFKERVSETFGVLFTETSEKTVSTNEEALGENFGWWTAFYQIAKGDLTKFEEISNLNYAACLTWLSFEKQKTEIELKKIKNAKQS